jgi:branched-chain amino acid transport system substrate-binding protein
MNVQPDLVVISSLATDGASLIKQLRDLGYTGLIVGGNGLSTTSIFPVCQKQCDGILVAQAYSPQLDTPINKQLVDTYAAEQKKTPGQFTAQAFAAVQVLVEALQAVDQQTPIKDMALADLRNALNDQLLSGMTFETPLGEISFDPEGELNQSQFYVAQIKMDSGGKNGQFVLLK